MIGGIYGYLGIALAAGALVAGAYFTGRSDGRALERAEWVEQQNSDLRTTNAALDAAHRTARNKESAQAQALAAASGSFQKELSNVEQEKRRILDRLRTAERQLRSSPPPSRETLDGVPAAPACPSGRDGGAPSDVPGEVGAVAGELAVAGTKLMSEADALARQLTACQAVVRADRR